MQDSGFLAISRVDQLGCNNYLAPHLVTGPRRWQRDLAQLRDCADDLDLVQLLIYEHAALIRRQLRNLRSL